MDSTVSTTQNREKLYDLIEINVTSVSLNMAYATLNRRLSVGSIIECETPILISSRSLLDNLNYQLEGDNQKSINFQKYFPTSSNYTSCVDVKNNNPYAPPGLYALQSSELVCCTEDFMGGVHFNLQLPHHVLPSQNDRISFNFSDMLHDLSDNKICQQHQIDKNVFQEIRGCDGNLNSGIHVCSNWTVNLNTRQVDAVIYGRCY